MAIAKKTKEAKTIPQVEDHAIRILKASEMKDRADCYRFSMEINGITVYGCQYITYTDRDGKIGTFISFPQYYAKNQDKYYNHAWCALSENDKAAIESGIEEFVNA